ncbi:multidrug efflux MFS transporter [Limosilactobacillus fermentum]
METQIEPSSHSFNRLGFMATLLVGTFTMSISQSSLSTAYPTLMADFGISASTVQWLTTGFMLVMCVAMPISPWMLNNLSFKKMFMGALALFDLGSLVIVLTPVSWGAAGFWFMMVGRVLEAFAVGVLFPSYQTVLLEITPEKERGTTMGIAGLVMGSALAVGPIVSGVVLKYFSWQSLFIFFMIVITVIFALVGAGLIQDIMERHQSKLDWLSVFLLLGLIGLMWGINQVGKAGVNWDLAATPLAVSLLALAWFVVRQLKLATPLLELRVLKTFNYDLAVLLTSISYIALIVTTIIFPLYYQGVLGVSPFVSGMSLVPGAVFLSILNPLSGKLADRIGFKPTMLVGMAMIIIGWGAGILVVSQHSLMGMLLCAMVIEGGNAFVMMPAVTLGANALPDRLVAHGTAVITTVRQVLGSAGVVVATMVLTNVTNRVGQSGVSHSAASLTGFRAVFSLMVLVELVGLFLALLLKDTKKKPN